MRKRVSYENTACCPVDGPKQIYYMVTDRTAAYLARQAMEKKKEV